MLRLVVQGNRFGLFPRSFGQLRRPLATSCALPPMLDASDFERIEGELRAYDERREVVIKSSRDIQKASKQAIYSLHRQAVQEAEQRLATALSGLNRLTSLIRENPSLRPGSFASAVEEYVEALALSTYLREGRLIRQGEVEVAEVDEYLGGVLDFTGELGRLAVAHATRRDERAARQARDLVEAIMGQFLQFDLRNGALRKKYDSLKWTLRKLEQILYEMSLSLPFKPLEELPEQGAVGDGIPDER